MSGLPTVEGGSSTGVLEYSEWLPKLVVDSEGFNTYALAGLSPANVGVSFTVFLDSYSISAIKGSVGVTESFSHGHSVGAGDFKGECLGRANPMAGRPGVGSTA